MKISRRFKINKEIFACRVEIQILQSHLTMNFNLIPYEEKQQIYDRVDDLENRIKQLKQLKKIQLLKGGEINENNKKTYL